MPGCLGFPSYLLVASSLLFFKRCPAALNVHIPQSSVLTLWALVIISSNNITGAQGWAGGAGGSVNYKSREGLSPVKSPLLVADAHHSGRKEEGTLSYIQTLPVHPDSNLIYSQAGEYMLTSMSYPTAQPLPLMSVLCLKHLMPSLQAFRI